MYVYSQKISKRIHKKLLTLFASSRWCGIEGRFTFYLIPTCDAYIFIMGVYCCFSLKSQKSKFLK